MIDEQVNSLKNISFEEKRKRISSLGIYELRGVARALGVSSPTTKKRDFLIDAIMNSLNNENIEIVQNATKGRPYKKLESVDSIINLLGDNSVKEVNDITKIFTYEDIISFAQEIPVFEYHSDDVITKSGILRLTKKTSYFMDMEENLVVFVSSETLKSYDLQNGDLLECIAYKINENNQYCVKDILKINKVPVEDYFCEIKPFRQKIIPKRTANIGSKKIILGGRNVAIIEDPLFLETDTISILSDINYSMQNTVFLGLELCAEDRLLLEEYPHMVKFTTEYNKDNLSRDFDKIIDAINYCDRLTRSGEPVVLVIYDIIKILNALDLYFEQSDGIKVLDHYQQSKIIIEKLMSLSSAYSNGNDSTLLLICNDLDSDDKFMKNEILKISKKIK